MLIHSEKKIEDVTIQLIDISGLEVYSVSDVDINQKYEMLLPEIRSGIYTVIITYGQKQQTLKYVLID